MNEEPEIVPISDLEEKGFLANSQWLTKNKIGKYIPIGILGGLILSVVLTLIIAIPTTPKKQEIKYSELSTYVKNHQVIYIDSSNPITGVYKLSGEKVHFRVTDVKKIPSTDKKLFTGIDEEPLPIYYLFVGFIGIWIAFIVVMKLISKRFGTNKFFADFPFKIRGWDVPIGIGVGFLCQVATIIVLLPITLTSEKLSDQISSQSDSLIIHGGLGQVGSFLIIVLLAPIIEELFFRGFVYRWLALRNSPVWALVFSGMIFGAVHVANQPIGAPALMVVGAILSYTYRKSGRLGTSVVAHATFNLFTFVALVAR